MKKYLNSIFTGISTFNIIPSKQTTNLFSEISNMSTNDIEEYLKTQKEISRGQVRGFLLISILQILSIFLLIIHYDVSAILTCLILISIILYSKYFHKNNF